MPALNRNILILTGAIFLASCTNPLVTPITTGAAVVVGAYEKMQRRDELIPNAESGDVYAQYALAESYCCTSGEGGRDGMQAYEWFCKAAQNGHKDAQRRLGEYYEGIEELPNYTVQQDLEEAYRWYELAARRFDAKAKKHKERIEKHFFQQGIDPLDISRYKRPSEGQCVQ